MLDKGISIKEPEEDVESFNGTYTMSLSGVTIKNTELAKLFVSGVQDKVKIVFKKLLLENDEIFAVTFEMKATCLYNIVQVVKLFLLLMFAHNTSGEKQRYFAPEQVWKYLQQLVRLNLNYKLRCVFKDSFLQNSLFKTKYKELLERSPTHSYTFNVDSNLQQCKNYIMALPMVHDYKHIITLGDLAGAYYKTLIKKLVDTKEDNIYLSLLGVNDRIASKASQDSVQEACAVNIYNTVEDIKSSLGDFTKKGAATLIIHLEDLEKYSQKPLISVSDEEEGSINSACELIKGLSAKQFTLEDLQVSKIVVVDCLESEDDSQVDTKYRLLFLKALGCSWELINSTLVGDRVDDYQPYRVDIYNELY
jgi:hypothetical protein